MNRLRRAYRAGLWFGLFFLTAYGVNAQDFMMQGWYWDYPKPNCNNYVGPSIATELAGKAAALKNAGFTMLWLPPMSKASFGDCSNGYDPKDLYDYGQVSGQTGLGTGAQVSTLLGALGANGIIAVADVVYNHRDGGNYEDNPAVRNYVMNFPPAGCNGTATPYPVNGKVRYRLPLGGSSGNGAGNYYFKFSSASANGGFNGRPYKLYFRTLNTVHSSDTINEFEPNGGADCNPDQPNNQIHLGRDIFANQEIGSCNTDEFYLALSAGDFLSTGDNLEIYIEQVGGGGSGIDQRPYGIWSGSRSMDIINDLALQTRTNYAGMPSGEGAMNYLNFKPNGVNFTCMTGDQEYPYFFFDVEQGHFSTQTAYNDWTKWLMNTVGIGGLRMDAVKHFPASFVGQLINSLYSSSPSIRPAMVVGEHFTSNAGVLAGWVNEVNSYLSQPVKDAIKVRAFDFDLRDNLRVACESIGYDVRNIFNVGMRNGAGASPFSVVTMINNHDFRYQDVYHDVSPMLGYAYILTNNQVGLPCVFYPDYYGATLKMDNNVMLTVPSLKSEIDALISAHKAYIFGANQIDYLSRFSTPYHQSFTAGGASTTLFYQIINTSTGRNVLVAINFAGTQLTATHGVNTSGPGLSNGDELLKVAGSAGASASVSVSNGRVNLTVPAFGYAVWTGVSVLPLDLLAFEVEPEDKQVALQWTSANEVDFAGYDVQRSLDGTHFEKIGWVAAAGTPDGTTRSYHFQDKNPVFNKPLYYRLRMLDLDGTVEFSPLRSVTLKNEQEVLLFPNPTTGSFWLKFQHPTAENTWIEVRDALGRSVLSEALEAGALQKEVNIAAQPAGIYSVMIKTEGQVIWSRSVQRR
ncbi:MAG: T9SS type A sorting domain-containing protein [Saprospiraceae bacterium]